MMQLQLLLRLASSLLLLLEMMVLITPALPQLPSQALLRLVHLIAPMALLPSATTVLVLVLSPQVLMSLNLELRWRYQHHQRNLHGYPVSPKKVNLKIFLANYKTDTLLVLLLTLLALREPC